MSKQAKVVIALVVVALGIVVTLRATGMYHVGKHHTAAATTTTLGPVDTGDPFHIQGPGAPPLTPPTAPPGWVGDGVPFLARLGCQPRDTGPRFSEPVPVASVVVCTLTDGTTVTLSVFNDELGTFPAEARSYGCRGNSTYVSGLNWIATAPAAEIPRVRTVLRGALTACA